MKHFVSKIWNSPSVRDVGKLLSANVIAQALGLLIYPILTRLYSPEDFGLLSLFMSIGGIFVLVATADYQNAIVLPKEENRARAIVQVCIILLLSVITILIISIPFSHPIAMLFKAPDLAHWWWMMPLYVGGLGLWTILSNYYIRYKAFHRISVYQMSQSVLNAGGKLGLGAMGFLSGGMIVSTIVAPILAIRASLLNGGRRLVAGLFRVDKSALRNEAAEYRNFPLYSMPRSLVNTLSGNLPFLMLTPVFGLTELGHFGMAFTLSFRPMQIVVQSVYQVLYQRTAQLVNEKKTIGTLIFTFVKKMLLLEIPAFIGLYFALPALTEWLLGENWRIAGEYIRLLLPWLLMVSITTTINFIPDIFGKQRMMLLIEIFYLLLRIAALFVGIYYDSFLWTIRLFSYSGVIVLFGELLWFAVLARSYDKKTVL